MSDQLEFKISEGLIRPILQAKINLAITEALGGHEKLITDILNAYMNQSVDSEGKPSTYSSSKPRLTWLMHQMVEQAMKNALQSFLQGKTAHIQSEFEKFLNSKKGSSKIIEAIQTGFCESLTNKWRTIVTFQPPKD